MHVHIDIYMYMYMHFTLTQYGEVFWVIASFLCSCGTLQVHLSINIKATGVCLAHHHLHTEVAFTNWQSGILMVGILACLCMYLPLVSSSVDILVATACPLDLCNTSLYVHVHTYSTCEESNKVV